ncbi:MAG: terminase small subunit [Vicinamibacterales bacterium]
MAHELTAKQRRFADEYLVDLNATQAAIRAGYSPRTAGSIGEENLNKPEIAGYIAQRKRDRQRRVELSQDGVIRELARVGFSDITNVARWDEYGVHVIPSEELTPDVSASILSVKCKRRRLVEGDRRDPDVWEVEELEVKMHPKVTALAELRKHFEPEADDAPTAVTNVLNLFGSMPREQVEALAQRYAGSTR